jgi:CBS-domain-containing membrane protein
MGVNNMNGERKSGNGHFTAEMLMSHPVVFVRSSQTMRQAAALVLERGISGLPVLDHTDRAVGVLTKTDLVRYERERLESRMAAASGVSMKSSETAEWIVEKRGFHEEAEEDYVFNWMTPKVYSVDRHAHLGEVVREMLARRVHRLFVRGEPEGPLVGVLTTFDLLEFLARALHVETGRAPVRSAP